MMTSWRYNDSRWSERLAAPINWSARGALLAVAAAVMVVAAAAVTIARSDSAAEIAEDARIVAAASSASSAAALLNAEVGQGVVVAQAVPLGVVEAESAAESASRIRAGWVELEQRVDRLAQIVGAETTLTAAEDVERHVAVVAAALNRGDGAEAALAAESNLVPSLTELVATIETLSAESAERIAAVDAGLGVAATIARFVVALLIPAVAVLVLYRVLRRSQRASLLKSELDREHELRRKLDEFATATTHHLGASLAEVAASTDRLSRSTDLNTSARTEIADLLAVEVNEVTDVLADLAFAARHDLGTLRGEEERVELKDTVDKLVSDWTVHHPVTITTSGNAAVSGDKHHLAHAIGNLARNAAGSAADKVRIDISSAGDRVVVEVIDNGAVLPPNVNDWISETYYAHEEHDGLAIWRGLALSIARRIAKGLGGDLEYERGERMNIWRMTLPGASSHVLPRDGYPRTIDPWQRMPTLDAVEAVIDAGGPDIAYQPIVPLAPGEGERVAGYEAKARFESHDPADWFQAASRMGVGTDLGIVHLRSAIDQFSSAGSEAFLAVKVSDTTLHDPRLEAVVADSAPSLVLELSHHHPIPSYESTRRCAERLAGGGVSLAISGVCSVDLELFEALRPRLVKLDRSVLGCVHDSAPQRALVAGVVAVAAELGMTVVAEGVETGEEQRALAALGVELGQGSLFAGLRSLADPAGTGAVS